MTDPERAVVYTPQEGDVVVLEVDERSFTPESVAQLRAQAQEAFGRDVKIVVLSAARFAGVVRG